MTDAQKASKEGDLEGDTNFDDASLSLYTAELSENVSTDKDAAFHEDEKVEERQKIEVLKQIEKKMNET